MGLMSSKGGARSPKTRNLDGDWYMTYDSVTSVVPVQSAAVDLESYHNDIVSSPRYPVIQRRKCDECLRV